MWGAGRGGQRLFRGRRRLCAGAPAHRSVRHGPAPCLRHLGGGGALPLCALSVGIYLFRGDMDWAAALPYVLGGAAGGWAGGKWFRGVRLPWLKRIFGALLIFGGVRCIL